ncbi:FtsX-like permease family protein [Rhodocytophaga rosea]|uniref:FtsX-like permease family protein n=1 Tax=Rhodocytophaga rosea TaxID=2704465 RepID=A0A6C0GIL7_9BACT|nr:ABC transporter permease [Rhodocytophaga rosea]QHT67799.1 FtsX-like permease family protein [Rhodocytophaga rosea]
MESSHFPQPPKWAAKLLERLCPDELLEEIGGDLQELFEEQVEEVGISQARREYVLAVLGYLRPFAFKQKTHTLHPINFSTMINNYLKTSVRNLSRNKVYSLINISGLALGIVCCLVIFLVVRYELSYDTFHSKADRVYRINTKFLSGGFASGAPLPVAEALKQDFPEVEEATTAIFRDEGQVTVGDQLYKETGIAYVAPAFFSILDATWLAGNPKASLSEPNTVVLTKSIGQKYFGSHTSIEDMVGKFVKISGSSTLQVTGILEDFPANTDIPFKILISWERFKTTTKRNLNDWISFSGGTTHLILLREGTDVASLQKKIPAFEKKHMGDLEASRRTHILQPLLNMHFDEQFNNLSNRIVSKENLGGLSLIGVFILLTACINFINLSTAQSVKRSKEVGVRKVLGANRFELVRQFLSETALFSVLAMGMAVAIVYLLTPSLQTLLDLNIEYNPFKDLSLLAFLVIVTGAICLLAGIYPAVMLSRFKPVTALKNKIVSPIKGALPLRQTLIVVQFAITQILIISTLVVSGQLDYFRNSPLGFDKEAIITIPFLPDNPVETSRALRNQLEQIPGVQKISYALMAPSSDNSWWSKFTFEGHDPTKEYYVQEIVIDHTYLETFGLQLLAGKNLGPTSDSSDLLVNEAVLKTMNIRTPEEAIGKTIGWVGPKPHTITGVVKDFHTRSFKEDIPGVIMHRGKNPLMAGVKIEPTNMRNTIAQIEGVWKKVYPETIFEFTFLDEIIANFYREEVKMYQLFRIFSGIAIFISCLGLYGLISFMAVQRTKEIGIRKVLGASVGNLITLLSKDLLKLVLIANLIAWPLAWWLMDKWLQNFEYSIPLSIWIFAFAGILALLIALFTVGFQAMKAALANPIKSLRTE